MIPHPLPTKQSIPHARETWETFPYRRWHQQAQRLYRSPEAQRLALLHHLATMRSHAATPARALGRELAGGVM